MQSISRIVIAIPLMLVVFALALRFGGFIQPAKQAVQSIITPTIALGNTFRRTAEAQEPSTSPSIEFDLQKEYSCELKDPQNQYQIFIRRGDVRANIITVDQNTHLLLKNECLFTWSDTTKKGTRLCDLGPYIKAVSGMSKLGLFSFDSMLQSLFTKSGIKFPQKTENMTQLMNLCREESVAENVVALPEDVEFVQTSSLNSQN